MDKNNNGESLATSNDDLMQIVRLTATNVNGISEQMGLVLRKINDNSNRIAFIEDELVGIKQTTVIDRSQRRRIRKAVISRVNKVLKIKFEGGKVARESVATDVLYRGAFISRLYSDAKNHSKMGDSYYDTLKVDFDEVMEYIESWYPEVDGGADAYKHYIDIRREERSKSAAA